MLQFVGETVPPDSICRVLLVEDDEDNRDMYRTALESQGFSVVATDNGLRAFEAAFRTRPDIVVTDLAIPGIDGFELCRRLRSTGRTHEIPIIAITGRFTTAEDRRAGADYVDLYLVKPCEPLSLLSEIRCVVAHSRETRKPPAAGRSRKETPRDEACRRIRADFSEMPGLRVTAAQGARLWNLDLAESGQLLEELVRQKLLVRTAGRYHVS